MFVSSLVALCLAAGIAGVLLGWLLDGRLEGDRKRLRRIRSVVRNTSLLGSLVVAGALAACWPAEAVAVLPLLLVTAANLFLRDEFPFSHFPMYANFSERAMVLRVTDREGRPIATTSALHLVTKIYVAERNASCLADGSAASAPSDAARRRAGERALDFLEERSTATRKLELPEVVRLWELEVELRDGRIERRERLVGERRRC